MLYEPTLQPTAAQILGPVCAGAVIRLRCPELPRQARYALLARLEGISKPVAFASLADLARRIHRDRGTDALQLDAAQLRFRDQVRDVVDVRAWSPASDRVRRIGFAWIGGAHWRTLEAALDAVLPNAGVA